MQLNVHEVLREAQENIHKEPLRIIRQQRLVVWKCIINPWEDLWTNQNHNETSFNGERTVTKETGLYDEIGEQLQPPTQFVQTTWMSTLDWLQTKEFTTTKSSPHEGVKVYERKVHRIPKPNLHNVYSPGYSNRGGNISYGMWYEFGSRCWLSKSWWKATSREHQWQTSETVEQWRLGNSCRKWSSMERLPSRPMSILQRWIQRRKQRKCWRENVEAWNTRTNPLQEIVPCSFTDKRTRGTWNEQELEVRRNSSWTKRGIAPHKGPRAKMGAWALKKLKSKTPRRGNYYLYESRDEKWTRGILLPQIGANIRWRRGKHDDPSTVSKCW
jgi:hypothetical protein